MVKGVPVSLVEGLSNAIAHEALGQGVVYRPFHDVGELLGRSVKSVGENRQTDQKPGKLPAAVVELGQLAGVEVKPANTQQGRHSGVVVAAEAGYVIQDVGRDQGIAHDVADLDHRPAVGARVTVQYREGKGQTKTRSNNQMVLGL